MSIAVYIREAWPHEDRGTWQMIGHLDSAGREIMSHILDGLPAVRPTEVGAWIFSDAAGLAWYTWRWEASATDGEAIDSEAGRLASLMLAVAQRGSEAQAPDWREDQPAAPLPPWSVIDPVFASAG